MTDPLIVQVQLDGSKEMASGILEIKRALEALDKSSATKTLKAELGRLSTELATVSRLLELSVKDAATKIDASLKQVVSSSKKAGKEAGDAFADGQVMSVRANRQRLQAEYEKNSAKYSYQPTALMDLKSSGVQLFPNDAEKLLAFQSSVNSSSGVLATQRAADAKSSAEDASRLSYKIKLMAGSASIAKSLEAAAAVEDGARLKYKIKMLAGSAAIAQAQELAADRESAASLGWKAKMMVGALNYQTSLEDKAAREDGARLAYKIKMMAGSASIAQAQELAATRETSASLGWKAKMMVGALNYQVSLDEKAAREDGARLKYKIKMLTGAAAIAQAQELAANREASASLGWKAKMMVGAAGYQAALEAAAATEASARLAYIAKMQVGSLKISEAVAAEARKTRLAALSQAATVVTNRAAASPLGDYSVARGARRGIEVSPDLKPAVVQVGEAVKATADHQVRADGAAKVLQSSYGKLALQSRDLHSATRGLASGFGAMWLTWGSVGPLVAGAALSAAIVQTVKGGAQVNDIMTRMRVLTGESKAETASLNAQMLQLASTGPFGPLEVAEAMKTLALSGMKASEVASSVKDVLNFSLAGDVGIVAAAEALTTISTAFGVSASGFGYVSDTISKAAAESKASVESIAEAFKTASVINQQYGVTLEETAVGLSLLANAGIKGTAAGTALRNMYADLAGRTPKVREALKELGVTAFDPLTGKMRATGDVFKELLKSLEKRTPDGARQMLSEIFSERGSKEAFALLDSLRAKAKETGSSFESVYDEMLAKVTQSAGFASNAAAEIALTPVNQMKSVASALQSTLVSAFDSLQPYLVQTATRLKAIFGSDEFKSALSQLLVGIGKLTTFLLEHGQAIAAVLLSYMGFKAAVTVIAGVAGVMSSLSIATTTASTAVGALGLASRLATAANPLLMALGGLVALAAGAWAIYATTVKSASGEQSAGFTNHEALIENLRQEGIRLDKVNEARTLNITLQELEIRNSGRLQLSDGDARIAAARAKSEASAKDLADAAAGPSKEQRLAAERKARLTGTVPADLDGLAVANASKQAAKDKLEYERVKEQVDGERLQIQALQGSNAAKAQVEADAQRAEQAKRLKEQSESFKGLIPTTLDDGSKGSKSFSPKNDNALEQVSKDYSTQMSLIKSQEANKQKLLQASMQSTLIDKGTFYSEELRIVSEAENNELAQIEESTQKYQAEYIKRGQGVIDALEVWKGGKGKGASEAEQLAAVESYTTALENLENTRDSFMEKAEADRAKVKDSALTRMQLQAIAAGGELKKLSKTSADFWKAEAEAADISARAVATEDKLRFASPEDAARISAVATETERLNSKVVDYENTITTLRAEQNAFNDAMEAQGGGTTEQIGLWLMRNDVLQKTIGLQKELSDQIPDKAKAKGESAALKQIKDERDGMVKSVADALETGMFEGGKSGGKKLRDILKAELRKPITVAITALVNTVTNSLFGGAGSGGSGGMFGGLLDKVFGGSAAGPAAAAAPIFDPLAGLAAYAGLPGFANGTNYVPHDMVAQIHRGERIVTASRNAAESNQSDQRPIVVHQNFTVGDVASVSMVRQAVAGSEKRIAGAMGRSMKYGGALA